MGAWQLKKVSALTTCSLCCYCSPTAEQVESTHVLLYYFIFLFVFYIYKQNESFAKKTLQKKDILLSALINIKNNNFILFSFLISKLSNIFLSFSYICHFYFCHLLFLSPSSFKDTYNLQL